MVFQALASALLLFVFFADGSTKIVTSHIELVNTFACLLW